MSDEEVEDSELEGMIQDIPAGDYPPDLLAARRAEYVTLARTTRRDKKPGCRLLSVMTIGILSLVAWTSWLILTAGW